MMKKTFLASAASKVFALATVFMMSIALASCGGDGKDNPAPDPGPNPGPNPDPGSELPLPKDKTVHFDDREFPIKLAEYEHLGGTMYNIHLYMGEKGMYASHKVVIHADMKHHFTGSKIDLSKKEGIHDGQYWGLEYYNRNGEPLLETWGDPSYTKNPIFNTGNLSIRGKVAEGVEILLLNGRFKDMKGKDRTMTLSYSGKITQEYENIPAEGYVTINSYSEESIKSGSFEDKDKGNYVLHFNIGSKKEKVVIFLNKDYHIGKRIDLTQKESSHSGSYWKVEYYDASGNLVASNSGDPNDTDSKPLKHGILDITGKVDGDLHVKLKSGTLQGKGENYNVNLHYGDKLTEILPDTPKSIAGTVNIDGENYIIWRSKSELDTPHTGSVKFLVTYYLRNKTDYPRAVIRMSEIHFGKRIDLSLPDANPGTMTFWEIRYYDENGKLVFDTSALDHKQHFKRGTLWITGNTITTINVGVDNGVVMGKDSKLHTFSMWANKAPK